MTIHATDKTFDIMARKIQRWWKPLYYETSKAHNKRDGKINNN
jgi:hypothetical protein